MRRQRANLSVAADGQSSRCDYGGDWNRKNRYSAKAGRGISSRGVPVFMADIKGDLTGVTQAGGGNAKDDARNELLGITPAFEGFPATVWDVFGKQGHPLRATVLGNGPAADRPALAAQRHSGRRAFDRVQVCR